MKNKSKRAYSTILSNCKRDGEIDCYSIVFVNMNIMTEGGGWSVSSVFLWGFFFFLINIHNKFSSRDLCSLFSAMIKESG